MYLYVQANMDHKFQQWFKLIKLSWFLDASTKHNMHQTLVSRFQGYRFSLDPAELTTNTNEGNGQGFVAMSSSGVECRSILEAPVIGIRQSNLCKAKVIPHELGETRTATVVWPLSRMYM